MATHFEAHPDADIYRSLPGLGVVLGARVLGEFGDDPNRYTTAKSRKNYAGTSPLTVASGRKRAVLARHVRNRRLYDAIDQWAFCALNTSPGARHFYDQRRAAGDLHHQALRALGNRLVGILHGCRTTPPNPLQRTQSLGTPSEHPRHPGRLTTCGPGMSRSTGLRGLARYPEDRRGSLDPFLRLDRRPPENETYPVGRLLWPCDSKPARSGVRLDPVAWGLSDGTGGGKARLGVEPMSDAGRIRAGSTGPAHDAGHRRAWHRSILKLQRCGNEAECPAGVVQPDDLVCGREGSLVSMRVNRSGRPVARGPMRDKVRESFSNRSDISRS